MASILSRPQCVNQEYSVPTPEELLWQSSIKQSAYLHHHTKHSVSNITQINNNRTHFLPIKIMYFDLKYLQMNECNITHRETYPWFTQWRKDCDLKVCNLIKTINSLSKINRGPSQQHLNKKMLSLTITEIAIINIRWSHNHLITRTITEMLAFWGYPPAASWLPILLSHIRSQVKRRQSQSYKFKIFAKITNCCILKQTLHMTHLLKLLGKMCKYEMDPTSIVEDTEQTWFCPQTDKVKPVYPPFNFVEAGV